MNYTMFMGGVDLINIKIKGQQLILKTSNEVFSPSSIDKGAMAMLDIVEFKKGIRFLI